MSWTETVTLLLEFFLVGMALTVAREARVPKALLTRPANTSMQGLFQERRWEHNSRIDGFNFSKLESPLRDSSWAEISQRFCVVKAVEAVSPRYAYSTLLCYFELRIEKAQTASKAVWASMFELAAYCALTIVSVCVLTVESPCTKAV